MAYVKKIWKDYPDTTTQIKAEDLNNVENGIEAVDTVVNNGWVPATETWTYASVDEPTGNITISGDKTTKYSRGMRIKFTNGGNVIYGIITKIAYSSPNTTLTFLHEIDPTDSLAKTLMANSAITANYYSTMKAPYGFPLEQSKWTVYYSSITSVNQATPTQGVWYNIDNRKLDVPIGSWLLSYSLPIDDLADATNNHAVQSTLSTANNTENISLLCGTQQTTASVYMEVSHDSNILPVILTAKTSYYLNVRTLLTICQRLRYGTWKVFRIQAVCAYL